MNLQTLLNLNENTLRSLIGQVAERVRQTPEKTKHAKLRKSLLDICDNLGILKQEPCKPASTAS